MAETSKVTPFLMFTGRAQEALDFYMKQFSDAEILQISHYGPEMPDREGTVAQAVFRIGDQKLMAIDSPPVHDFDFTPSLSLFVNCENEAEIDRLAGALSEGGFVMMPLSTDYPFAAKYIWLNDRFGVSWQLSLAADD